MQEKTVMDQHSLSKQPCTKFNLFQFRFSEMCFMPKSGKMRTNERKFLSLSWCVVLAGYVFGKKPVAPPKDYIQQTPWECEFISCICSHDVWDLVSLVAEGQRQKQTPAFPSWGPGSKFTWICIDMYFISRGGGEVAGFWFYFVGIRQKSLNLGELILT